MKSFIYFCLLALFFVLLFSYFFLFSIPVIGVLFSSKDFEERGKEVLFILTPSISTGGIPNKEIVDEIRHKHEMLELDNNILKTFTDPLGHNIYTEMIEKEATDAETKRIRAEIEKDHAVRKAKMLQMELDLARQGKTITSPSQKAKEVVDYQQKHRKKSPHELTIEQWMKKHADKNAKSDL